MGTSEMDQILDDCIAACRLAKFEWNRDDKLLTADLLRTGFDRLQQAKALAMREIE